MWCWASWRRGAKRPHAAGCRAYGLASNRSPQKPSSQASTPAIGPKYSPIKIPPTRYPNKCPITPPINGPSERPIKAAGTMPQSGAFSDRPVAVAIAEPCHAITKPITSDGTAPVSSPAAKRVAMPPSQPARAYAAPNRPPRSVAANVPAARPMVDEDDEWLMIFLGSCVRRQPFAGDDVARRGRGSPASARVPQYSALGPFPRAAFPGEHGDVPARLPFATRCDSLGG